MPLEQPSEEDRQLQLAKVERLRIEYLDAKAYFLRILTHDKFSERGNALMKAAATARKVALSRYITAAAGAPGED